MRIERQKNIHSTGKKTISTHTYTRKTHSIRHYIAQVDESATYHITVLHTQNITFAVIQRRRTARNGESFLSGKYYIFEHQKRIFAAFVAFGGVRYVRLVSIANANSMKFGVYEDVIWCFCDTTLLGDKV